MLLLASVIFSVVVSPLVLSAPVASLDVAALLQNGEQAQKLNAVFQNFKIIDKCTSTCFERVAGVNYVGSYRTSRCRCMYL